MPSRRLTDDVAGASIERGIEGERAMTKIFQTVPLGSAGGEWQNRIQPVEALDRALLIDTEDRRVGGRLHIQANHVGGFLFERRIVAEHVTTRAMRLDTEMAP